MAPITLISSCSCVPVSQWCYGERCVCQRPESPRCPAMAAGTRKQMSYSVLPHSSGACAVAFSLYLSLFLSFFLMGFGLPVISKPALHRLRFSHGSLLKTIFHSAVHKQTVFFSAGFLHFWSNKHNKH